MRKAASPAAVFLLNVEIPGSPDETRSTLLHVASARSDRKWRSAPPTGGGGRLEGDLAGAP